MHNLKRTLVAFGAISSALLLAPRESHADNAQTVRGVIRAEAAATVASELVARVSSLPFKTGQSFKKGEVLITFDCSRYQAELRAAEAEAKSSQITVDSNRQLLRHRAAGANELAIAEAKLGQALAAVDSLRVRTSQCAIAAPWDGRMVERNVDVFEMPQANAPLIRIVKVGALELDLIVPSSWAVWLRPGYDFSFTVDETGVAHAARLLHLGAVVDPISRTMKISAKLLDPGPEVRPGMSGVARLVPPAQTPPTGDRRHE